MDLLVLKSNDDYIRVVNDEYQRCGLDKASVFPMAQRHRVAGHLKKMRSRQVKGASVARLRIQESPYDMEVQ